MADKNNKRKLENTNENTISKKSRKGKGKVPVVDDGIDHNVNAEMPLAKADIGEILKRRNLNHPTNKNGFLAHNAQRLRCLIHYQRKGLFAKKDNLMNMANLQKFIFDNPLKPNDPVKDPHQHMGYVGALIPFCETHELDITAEQQIALYRLINKTARDLKEKYEKNRDNGEKSQKEKEQWVIWNEIVAKVQKYYDDHKYVYGKVDPTPDEIAELQKALIIYMQVFLPSPRAFFATLCLFDHIATSAGKDNVVVWNKADETDDIHLIWNYNKRDIRFVQSVNGTVKDEMMRWIERFRKGQRYLFSDADGTKLKINTFCKMVGNLTYAILGKRIGVQVLRVIQINAPVWKEPYQKGTLAEKRRIARLFQHSTDQHEKYMRTDDEIEKMNLEEPDNYEEPVYEIKGLDYGEVDFTDEEEDEEEEDDLLDGWEDDSSPLNLDLDDNGNIVGSSSK